MTADTTPIAADKIVAKSFMANIAMPYIHFIGGHRRCIGGDRRFQSFSHQSTTQVSFTPPPWEEFTTSEPSRSATRVRPPGTKVTLLAPEST